MQIGDAGPKGKEGLEPLALGAVKVAGIFIAAQELVFEFGGRGDENPARDRATIVLKLGNPRGLESVEGALGGGIEPAMSPEEVEDEKTTQGGRQEALSLRRAGEQAEQEEKDQGKEQGSDSRAQEEVGHELGEGEQRPA